MKRILIIAGGLQIGGAEKVAANISKYAPNGLFEFHYVVFEGIENVYGAEIEQAGGTVFTIPPPSQGYGAYLRTIGRLMKKYRYDAVHSHTMFNSGLNLALAKVCGIPCRIAHSHTTKTETAVSVKQYMYEQVMRILIRQSATAYFACGFDAGCWMFGCKAFKRKGHIISNGIDTLSFAWSAENRNKIRAQYHAEDAFIIGHCGTLLPLKNQIYLINLMPQILQRKPNAVLMLLGNGTESYLQELKRQTQLVGVEKAVLFCGGVANVNEYLSAFDVFAFPSLREGTPLALIEAQANGLPCVISDCIPADACLTDLVIRLPGESAHDWTRVLCTSSRSASEKYVEIVASKGYDARAAYIPIYKVYLGEEI